MSLNQTIARNVRRTVKASLCAVTPARRAASVPVLAYHSIDGTRSPLSVSAEEFRGHLAFLRRHGWEAIGMRQYVDRMRTGANRPREILITFDDGYENFLLHAAPALQEFGFKATVFVPTDFVGATPAWFHRDDAMIRRFLDRFGFNADERRRLSEGNARLSRTTLLSWDQLRELVRRGFDVQSHTAGHCFLTTLTIEQIQSDLKRAKAAIEENLQLPADTVCYPYGDCDDRVAQLARAEGYVAGFRSEYCGPGEDRLKIGRTCLGGDETRLDLRFTLSGAADMVARWRRRGAALDVLHNPPC